ncbi:phosphoribosylformylglycinamidine cyclo-ligase [Candidatus Gottesmanbacteria bacterium RIFCSPLOWO2_01_FULL_39_12b]|uniref:Phosphoribosylformylglycinamidine cyclo-ligase n=1 Tax=Candidatus Gottesmanbacteria bacterium RIFCSPLOWO2_01_FULL_39_12b TaxID=1798388 RepID=A0A1F6AQ67_9BACT|nr:MAG: phosphoribosylformylglycinamidine cyclo-ligase [Candidatus Gottesmanbacteria bacterium RIFCSPLOWO2_01_FULL_39_12b]
MSLTYKKSGVNYDIVDPIKKLAQELGLKTAGNIRSTGFKERSESRGESSYVIESADGFYAFVTEGLGTKNLVADEMHKITGKIYYESIAQDCVAMIVNDLITVGAKPVTVLAYWAVGDTNWFSDLKRASSLVEGWKKACDMAGCSWGGGETPVQSGVVNPSIIDLAGSSFGVIKPKKRLILGDKLKEGDSIILLESSGIHANGLTLARRIARKLKTGYATKLPNGSLYGDELLKPTIIYSMLINDLLERGIDIHYLVNITGHGWRKLMRAKKTLSYVLENVPDISELFKFIQKNSNLTDKEMFATFNMGAGFAMMTNQSQVDKIIRIAGKHKIKCWVAGRVEKGLRQVVIKPKNITYLSKDLKIR